MPTYTMTGPDGRVYQLQAGADVPRERVEAELRRRIADRLGVQPTPTPAPVPAPTPAPTPAPRPTPRPAQEEEEPGFFDVLQSYTTDNPMRLIRGGLGAVETGINLFGADNAVSDILRGAQEGITEYLISDTTKRKAEERAETLEGKGFFETLPEVPGLLLRDPGLIFDALGSVAPSAGIAYVTGGASLPAQGAALFGTGAAMGAGAIKGSIYDATRDELINAGMPQEEAERAASEAQSYAGENLDMIALGGVLGGIASRTGIEPGVARLVAGRILGRSVGQAAGREALETAIRQAAQRSAQRGAVRTAVTEAGLEGAQGAQEQFAANLALQRQGMDVDLMEGVGSAAALEGTLGGILGAGFEGGAAAARAISDRRIARTPEFQQTFEAEQARLYDAEVAEMAAENPEMDSDAVVAAVEANQRQRSQTARQNALAMVRAQRAAAAQQGEVDPEAAQASIDEEYLRGVTAQVEALRAQNPRLTQRQAFDQVMRAAPNIYDATVANLLFGGEPGTTEGGAGAGTTGAATPGPRADDAGLAGPVGGGAVAGVPSVGGTELPGAGVAPAGDIVGGRVGQSVAGLPISDVGAGAQPRALTAIAEAPNRNERRTLAMQLVSDIAQTNSQLQGLSNKKYNTAATRIETAVTRGEAVDPTAVLYEVAGIKPVAPPTPTVQPTVAEGAVPKPEIFRDNPGGEWEARKQRTAEQEQAEALQEGEDAGTAARMLNGSTTQTIRRVEIPVEKLRTLEGVNKEQPAPGEPKYDALRKSVDESGFDREKAGLPMVWVNHKGEAFLFEGNNRVAVAAEEGIKSLPVEIQYRNGAENAPGPFAPDQVLATAPEVQAEPTVAETATMEGIAPEGEELSDTDPDVVQAFDRLVESETAAVATANPGVPEEAVRAHVEQYSPLLREAAKQQVREQRSGVEVSQAPEVELEPTAAELDFRNAAMDEAQARGLDAPMFAQGALDAQRNRGMADDRQILTSLGPDSLASYKAGAQWGQSRTAETQAAPAPEPKKGRGKKAAEPEQGTLLDIPENTANLVNEPRSTDIMALAEELPEPVRVNIRARLARIMAQYAKDNDVARLLRSLEELLADVTARVDRNRAKRELDRTRGRVRGFERAMEVLYRAERTGQLTPEAANLARWLLQQNPRIADELALSLRLGGAGSPAGQYSPVERLATIFTSRANDGTAAHEILHHAERLMPEKVREGIRAAWMKRIQDLTELAERTGNTNMREVLGTVVRAYYGDAQAQQELLESFNSGTIPYSVYHLSNPSEFWAVNATDLIGKRAARSGWTGAARNWLEGFIERVKDLFGFTNDAAIIKGLNAVLAAESGTIRGQMLSAATTRFMDQTAPDGTPQVVANGKPVVLTPAQRRTALAKAKAHREKMNRIQKRIAATNNTADLLGDGIELAKLARGDETNWALLRGMVDTLSSGKWRVMLPLLSTEDIYRILKGRLPGLTEADRLIRNDVRRFETLEYLQLSEELEQISAFLKKHPKAAQALSDLEFATVAYQVDPSKADTAEAYFNRVDGKAKELRAEIKAEKDSEKKKRLERKLDARRKDIESIYKGVPGDEGVFGWNDLNRSELGNGKGKEIFKLIRDAHRRDLEAKYEALRSRLKETKDGETLASALEKLEAQFKPALDQVIYFPAMRFGSYYARVGTGANSIFKMFDSELERNQFRRVMEQRGETITEYGNVEDLRNQFDQVTGGPLKEVLDLFDGDPKDIGALKGQVFDLWLRSLSAGDMRKHMAPRQMRAGYSTDILKNFANFRRSSISDLKRAKYGYKLRTEISRAKDAAMEMPNRDTMENFIKEIELRALSDLMPPDRGNRFLEGAIQLGTKMAFYQYLATPSAAVIQLSQLHIVALPILAQKYGHAKATAALTKYGFSGLAGFAVSPFTAVKKEDGGYTFDWKQPNLRDNPVSTLKQESDPQMYEVMSEGWQEATDLGMWQDTFANEGGFGSADPEQRSVLQDLMKGRVHTAAWRGTTFAFEAMGSLMHQMERVNREATYMAALELEYRENKKKGMSHGKAKKAAIEAAKATLLEATFDFSAYNKPRVLTTAPGRVAGQFYSFPYMMSSLFIRKWWSAIAKSDLTPEEKAAARFVAIGTSVNLFAYAGLTGLPVYGILTTLASMALWIFDGEDEEEEGGLSYIDENGNLKATQNINWWFRNVFLPRFLGPDSTVQSLLGYDDDTAALVVRSLEMGPISAITDVNLANSTALDFMFFLPNEPRFAETPVGKIAEYTLNFITGATGNLAMDYVRAGMDLANGYTGRALERALPKLYSNPIKAQRFAEEGQLNYNRELVGMDEEFWSSDKAIIQGFGWTSTEASQRQQQNFEGRKITMRVEKARNDMMAQIRRVALDKYQYGDTPEVRAAEQQLIRDWVEFNRTYPTHVIGLDSLYEVQTNAVNDAVMSRATRGVPLDERGKTPYLRDIYLERLRAEQE